MKLQEEFNSNFRPQHYLQLEAKRFETTLKHFFDIGIINPEDYQFLSSNLKMIKTFLKTRSTTREKRKYERPDYWANSYNYKQHLSHRHIRSQKAFSHSDLKQLSLFDVNNPLPIIGKIEVTGLNESLQLLKTKDPERAGPKFPFKIPAGTHWNQVIIKFLDNERIEMHVKKLSHITDYKEIGMVGKGNVPTPSEQWIFLKVLSQCNGEISIKDTEARDTYKKQKQALTEILQLYFSIDYDPFYPYKSSPEKRGNSYKIKLTLIPPPAIAMPGNPTEIEKDILGIEEYLKEEAPQVLEP